MIIKTLARHDLLQAIESLLPPPRQRYDGPAGIEDPSALAGVIPTNSSGRAIDGFRRWWESCGT
jgi:hypothetical protein